MGRYDGLEGKLPPGAAEQLAGTLEGWRADKERYGLNLLVGILPGPGCQAAASLEGKAFDLDAVPTLPVAGCVRKPCCGCCYVAVQPDLTFPTSDESAESDRQFEELMSQLSPEDEAEARKALADALAGFGITE